MIEANFSRARRAAMVDRLAAAQILQEALDSVNTAIA
jgi:RNase H-fold protein (predicted Holliday junction resolvase)